MSLLGGCFVPWLLFTLWMYGECDALVFLFHWPALLVLGAGIQWLVEGGTLGKDGLWDPQKNFPGWKGGCSWCSVAVLGMRQGFRLGKQRAEKVCWQPTWFSGRCGLRQECPLLTGSFSFLLFICLFVYLTLFLFYTLCLYILYKMFKDFHCNFEFKRILLERINAKIDSKAILTLIPRCFRMFLNLSSAILSPLCLFFYTLPSSVHGLWLWVALPVQGCWPRCQLWVGQQYSFSPNREKVFALSTSKSQR